MGNARTVVRVNSWVVIYIYMRVDILIASADRIRLSADALIVFLNAIRESENEAGRLFPVCCFLLSRRHVVTL